MLEVNRIREEKSALIQALQKRGVSLGDTLDRILDTDDRRKKIQAESDGLLAESNSISKQIGELYKQGKREEAEALKARPAELKEDIQRLKEEMSAVEDEIRELLYTVPNAPHDSVPDGQSDADNEIVSTEGEVPSLHEGAKPHWELAEQYGLIDFELGVKITGAGFPVYMGKGAKLQRALINFFLGEAEKAGFQEVIPPHVVNESSGYGTGQLPDKEGQMYHMQVDDLYMIPTAEVPITNMYRDVILKEEDLPVKQSGYTPCFRREAGSYGKDVRGLNRLHQFDKVEIVVIEHPDRSYAMLEQMVAHVVELLRKLELPFRKLRLCGGDLGFTSALTYDMEVYSAAQKRWLEVSSISNFETFQANRLKLRYRGADKKNRLAHTLNGSALALPRILAALLENNQTPEGIKIPEVLVPFTGFDYIR
ncbi:MAG: serine--tRNA ligase [Flavobacteriales bacterium]|nr:serine--tRNA ligase [Flavobacteriales bacterium]